MTLSAAKELFSDANQEVSLDQIDALLNFSVEDLQEVLQDKSMVKLLQELQTADATFEDLIYKQAESLITKKNVDAIFTEKKLSQDQKNLLNLANIWAALNGKFSNNQESTLLDFFAYTMERLPNIDWDEILKLTTPVIELYNNGNVAIQSGATIAVGKITNYNGLGAITYLPMITSQTNGLTGTFSVNKNEHGVIYYTNTNTSTSNLTGSIEFTVTSVFGSTSKTSNTKKLNVTIDNSIDPLPTTPPQIALTSTSYEMDPGTQQEIGHISNYDARLSYTISATDTNANINVGITETGGKLYCTAVGTDGLSTTVTLKITNSNGTGTKTFTVKLKEGAEPIVPVVVLETNIEFDKKMANQEIAYFNEIFKTSQPKWSSVRKTAKDTYERDLYRIGEDDAVVILGTFKCDQKWKVDVVDDETIYAFEGNNLGISINKKGKVYKLIWWEKVANEIEKEKKEITTFLAKRPNWPWKSLIGKDIEKDEMNNYSIIWPDLHWYYKVIIPWVDWVNVPLRFDVSGSELDLVNSDYVKEPENVTYTNDSKAVIKDGEENTINTTTSPGILFLSGGRRYYLSIIDNDGYDELLLQTDTHLELGDQPFTDEIRGNQLYNSYDFTLESSVTRDFFDANPLWKSLEVSGDTYNLSLYEEWWLELTDLDPLPFVYDGASVNLDKINVNHTWEAVPFDRNYIENIVVDSNFELITNEGFASFFDLSKHVVDYIWVKLYDYKASPEFNNRRAASVDIKNPDIANDVSNFDVTFDKDNDANDKIESMNEEMAQLIELFQVVNNLGLDTNRDPNELVFSGNNKALWDEELTDDNLNSNTRPVVLRKEVGKDVFDTDGNIDLENVWIERDIMSSDGDSFRLRFNLTKIGDEMIVNDIMSLNDTGDVEVEEINGVEVPVVKLDYGELYKAELTNNNTTINFKLFEKQSEIESLPSQAIINELAKKFLLSEKEDVLPVGSPKKSRKQLVKDGHAALETLSKNSKLNQTEEYNLESYFSFFANETRTEIHQGKTVNVMNAYLNDPALVNSDNQTAAWNKFKTKYEPELNSRGYKIVPTPKNNGSSEKWMMIETM